MIDILNKLQELGVEKTKLENDINIELIDIEKRKAFALGVESIETLFPIDKFTIINHDKENKLIDLSQLLLMAWILIQNQAKDIENLKNIVKNQQTQIDFLYNDSRKIKQNLIENDPNVLKEYIEDANREDSIEKRINKLLTPVDNLFLSMQNAVQNKINEVS